jgi:hypothetical protein
MKYICQCGAFWQLHYPINFINGPKWFSKGIVIIFKFDNYNVKVKPMLDSLAFTMRQEENAKALKISWSNIFYPHNYITSIAYIFLKYTISAQLKPILIHTLMINSHWIHHELDLGKAPPFSLLSIL